MYMRGATESHRTSHLCCHSQVAQTWHLLSLRAPRRQLMEKTMEPLCVKFFRVPQNIVSCVECAQTRENHAPIETWARYDGLVMQVLRFGDAFHREKWRKSHQTTAISSQWATAHDDIYQNGKKQLEDLIGGFKLIEDSFGVAMMINGNLSVSAVDASVRRRR